MDYMNAEKVIASEYNLFFVDNYNIGMGKFTRSTFYPSNDGTHPNEAGRSLIARHMAKEVY